MRPHGGLIPLRDFGIYRETWYFLIFRYRVASPMPSSRAARRRFPPHLSSAFRMAEISDASIVSPAAPACRSSLTCRSGHMGSGRSQSSTTVLRPSAKTRRMAFSSSRRFRSRLNAHGGTQGIGRTYRMSHSRGLTHGPCTARSSRPEFDDAARGVELTAFLSFGAGELRQKILIDAAQNVLRAALGIAYKNVADKVDKLAQAQFVKSRPRVVLRQHPLERGPQTMPGVGFRIRRRLFQRSR